MAEKVTSLEDIARDLEKRAERPLYIYTVPKALAEITGVQTVGIVELTPKEMLLAQTRAGGDKGMTLFEMIKLSWRQINGRAIHTDDATSSAEVEWSRAEPGWSKLRTLLGQAFNKVNNPSTEENDAFLASESVTIGR